MCGSNVLELLYSNLLAESRDDINFKSVFTHIRICFVLNKHCIYSLFYGYVQIAPNDSIDFLCYFVALEKVFCI